MTLLVYEDKNQYLSISDMKYLYRFPVSIFCIPIVKKGFIRKIDRFC